MKPPLFDYVRARSIHEAADMLAEDSDDSKILAGGQSLMPMLNMRLSRPERLIDIGRIPSLDYVDSSGDGRIEIGAAASQGFAAAAPLVKNVCPVLAEAILKIGHPQIRSRGTVCGSLAHHDPSAELPAVALALDATFSLFSAEGPRQVQVEQFFLGTFLTDLRDDEILVATSFKQIPIGSGWAVDEVCRTHGDFALAGAIAGIHRVDGVVDWARIVLFGVGSTPVRSIVAEQLLMGQSVDADLAREAGRVGSDLLSPASDVHGSADYRRELAAALMQSTIVDAWERSV